MKKKFFLFFLGFILNFQYVAVGQQNKIDSLQNVLKSSKEDTTKVNTLNILSRQFINTGLYEQALLFTEEELKLALTLNFKKGMAHAYSNIGIIYFYQGDYEKALDNDLKSLKIQEETEDKIGMANSYNNIGVIYEFQGIYQKALDNHFNALKIREEIADKLGIAGSYTNIGLVYYRQRNFEKALDNYLKCLKISKKIDYKPGIAGSYGNIGLIYSVQGNYEKAIDNYLKCLKISQEMADKRGIALAYLNIGNVFTLQDKVEESYHYLSQSLNLFKEIGDKDGVKDIYSSLSDLYEKKGEYKQAYNYHKLYSDIKDTLLNEQSNKQIAEMNAKYDSEKKDKELIKKDAEISKQQAETEKQNFQRNAFIIGFTLVIVLAFFIYRGYRQKKSANKLLEEKNILIEKQKQLVEEKNLKITDSINYANRIQQAILPSQELIKSFLPESFIFFRPKDIVSGDFYWFSEKKEKLLIAIADCTGHGVPGAFMSMIGNTLLNEIVNVKNICDPDEILNQLNKGIVSLLNQSNTESGTQDDGMDITILSIDKVNNEIEFAAANHFSYVFNPIQCETLKGDVFSIGGMFWKSDIKFTSQKIKVEKGTTIYLFTDGFIDQFGGEKNSKFLSSRFEQLLQNAQQCDMEEQHENLITAFDNWKGDNKQLDDLLVVGIRL